MKSHRSHDVVLLCFDCLSNALKQQDILKRKLAVQYDANMKEISKFYKLNHYIFNMQGVSKTLANNWEKIPTEKRNNLVALMKEGSEFVAMMQRENDIKEIIPEHLTESLEGDGGKLFDLIKYCQEPKFQPLRLSNQQKTNPHGEKVVKAILKTCEGDDYTPLEEFVRMWRQHFVEVLKPKYLPHGWNVDHKMQRSFGEHSIFRNQLKKQEQSQ